MPQHSLDCVHQNVLLPISCSLVPSYWKRGLSVILPMICMSQVIQNQVSPNDPSAWSFFMHIYTNRHGSHVSIFSKMSESKDPPTWSFFMRSTPIWLKWQCHKYVVLSLLSYIFWHEHVYHYDRDSMNHLHWVYDHRRFYSCKQNTNYSLTLNE